MGMEAFGLIGLLNIFLLVITVLDLGMTATITKEMSIYLSERKIINSKSVFTFLPHNNPTTTIEVF